MTSKSGEITYQDINELLHRACVTDAPLARLCCRAMDGSKRAWSQVEAVIISEREAAK